MRDTILKSFTQGAWALAVALVAYSHADAAPIDYGDFTGTTVMYLDVTETANTPGDEEPLYGDGVPGAPHNPGITGNKLDFDPLGFSAAAAGGLADITDGQLNFTLMAAPGTTLEVIELSEGGDYTLFGTGTAVTQVGYGVALGSVTVTELNGVAILPVALGGASVFGSADLVADGPVIGAGWDLFLSYDVDAALVAAGFAIGIGEGATKLEIAIDNTLVAINEPSSAALIVKKDFMIDVSPIDPFEVPEPSSVALLGLALCGLGTMGRRKG